MPIQPYTGVIAWNNFEGGTNGTNVTTANSGGVSGTAFSGIQISGTGTITYVSSSPIHDTMSMQVSAIGGITIARWDTAVVGSRTRLCGVAYVKWAAWPSGYTAFAETKQTDGGTLSSRLKISSTGLVRLVDTADATVFTASTPLSLNTVYRVEWDINNTTGAYTVSWFPGDSLTPVESIKTGTGSFGTAQAQVNFGRAASPDHVTVYDTVAINTTPLGPRATAGITSKPSALVSNAGTWVATGGTVLDVVKDASDATYIATPDAPSAAQVRFRMDPLSLTEIVTVKTKGMASNGAQTIQRSVSIYNGATLLVTDTWNLTTTAVVRSTSTPAAVTAGVELEVLISDTVI